MLAMESTNNTRNNRMVLLLIAGVPVTMVLGATWLWYFVAGGALDLVGVIGTANRGVLVQPPRQLNEVTLNEVDGASIRYADLDPRWTMVIPGSAGRCDRICEHNLYVTRQIHIGLGKEFNRVRRLYVSESAPDETQLAVELLSDERPAPASFAQYLASEHRDLQPLQLSPANLDRLFAEYRQEPSSWFLVDPAGWIMMSYNDNISYRDVTADLKFLLKNSSG
jgi:hypothetical protein